MTATAHALVGGAIAVTVHDPILGFTLAAVSHPLLDIIPHWDAAWNWRSKSRMIFFGEAVADVCIGLVATYWLFGSFVPLWYLALCVFGACFWDGLEIPYWFWHWRFPPFSWSHRIQSQLQGKAKLPWGVVSQVVTVGLVLLVAFQFIN